jgi:pyruvate kinase
VQVMKRVILYTEQHPPLRVIYPDVDDHSKGASISKAVINLAKNVQAVAVVAETKSGATALQISSYRPDLPLIAVTSETRTAQQLAIVYAAKSYVRPVDKMAATKLTNWLQENKVLSKGDIVVTASGRYPGVVGTTDTIKVRVLE